MTTVVLDLPHAVLRTALESALRDHPFFTVADSLSGERADVAVTTARACDPRCCATLARSGTRVVVLTTSPRPDDELAYRQAGAARYLVMGADALPIADILVEVVTESGESRGARSARP